ncbi:MAG: hypothetical protein ACI9OJ_002483 [Myxococcota bacterium]|jgi:hypothetical protein
MSLHDAIENCALGLQDETGLVAVIAVAARAPLPVTLVTRILTELVERSGGSVVRDDVDTMVAIRFRAAGGAAGKPANPPNWSSELAEIAPDSDWLEEARQDHAVLQACAPGGRVDPVIVAGKSSADIGAVTDRFRTWAASGLIVSNFDDASGIQTFTLPTLEANERRHNQFGAWWSSHEPKPWFQRRPVQIGGVIAVVVVVGISLLGFKARSTASGLADECRKRGSQLEVVQNRRAELTESLKTLQEMAGGALSDKQATLLTDELTGATNRIAAETKRFNEAQNAYTQHREGSFGGWARAGDDTACGFDP